MARTITKDMTSGSPTLLIIKFAIPMLIGNMFQQFYNMVDSIVVGKFVGKEALAAVGATGALNFFIFSLTFGLSAGISIVVSQYFGAKDYDNVRKSVATAAYTIFGVSVIMGSVGILLSRWLLQLLNTPDSIIDQSTIYMRIMFLGILGIAGYNGISFILRALGDSITPLIFLIVASLLNVGFDLLFVIVFGWGVAGVATATIIAQGISAIGCITYALMKVKIIHMPLREFKPNLFIFKKTLKLGLPVALQNSMISISLMALQRITNSFGDVVIAAVTVASRIEQLILQPGMSIGAAVSSFTGQNIGADQIQRAKKGFYSASKIIIALSLVMLPVMYFGGEHIMILFTKKEDIEVVRIGLESIRVTSFFYTFVGMIFITRNFLIGSGDIGIPMAMGISEVVCRVLFANLLVIPWGYRGIWWATALTWLFTSFIGISRVLSGKWKNKSVVKRA